MSAPRNRKHILIPGPAKAESYTPHKRRINPKELPAPASRPAHGKKLEREFQAAVIAARNQRTAAGIQVHGAEPGIYVQFVSQPGVPLTLSSLENAQQGIELVAVLGDLAAKARRE